MSHGGPAVCPNGHAMDEGLFDCPACGAYRPSGAGRTQRQIDDLMQDVKRAAYDAKVREMRVFDALRDRPEHITPEEDHDA